MELENIVANTVYIKARAGEGGKHKGRSKKWKQMLKLPHITECLHIRNELPLTKDFLIDNQPIGKKLFRQFCAQSPVFDGIFQFIEEVVSSFANRSDPFKWGTVLIFVIYRSNLSCLKCPGISLMNGPAR